MDIRELIKKHEGVRLWAYTDSLGIWTTACGFNIERAGARQALAKAGVDYDAIWAEIKAAQKLNPKAKRTKNEVVTMAQVDVLLDADIAAVVADCKTICPQMDTWPIEARAVVLDLCFNMGITSLRGFKNTLKFLNAKNWKQAAANLKLSKWYTQVGIRADENIGLLESIK